MRGRNRRRRLCAVTTLAEKGATTAVYVEIVEFAGGKVSKRMGPMSRTKASKVQGGANINLNHKRFYTRIVNDQEGMRDGS